MKVKSLCRLSQHVLRQEHWGCRRQRKCQTGSYAATNTSVFRRALKVVMVAELYVTEDREFQTAGK